MELFNFITQDPQTVTEQQFKTYQETCDTTCNYLIDGIGAIGNFLYWVVENDDYNNDDLRTDMRNIGLMLSVLPETIQGLKGKLNMLSGRLG